MQMLIVKTPEGPPRVFDLFGEDVSIGRDRIHDMQLAHASVSREHAAVVWASGAYTIQDKGSHNGVYVNEVRVEGCQPLASGDVIQIGHFELIYVDGALPKRFAKLDVHSMQRWYALGAETQDGSTHQLSKTKMDRLLKARRLLEYACLVDGDGQTIELEDREWVLGQGADLPLKGLFMSPKAARLSWNGQNHVLQHTGGWRPLKVNGTKVSSCTLEHGDFISIGSNQMTYEVRA
jgi:pSer/pThr/pTyr-binding forkhead associated (FHA) protein